MKRSRRVSYGKLVAWLKSGENQRTSAGSFSLLLLLSLSALWLLSPVFSQTPTPSPTPTPAPSPSPSPTPPPNLHQWGAVTSFHGLPSDRTHAIAQTEYGVTWFATDGGLARFDGRRTSAVIADGLPPGRVLALKQDKTGALWIGTENGAARLWRDKFDAIKETAGKVITAIITAERDHAFMASENGQIFDCRVRQEAVSRLAITDAERDPPVRYEVRTIPEQPLQSSDKDQPGLLKITSLALVNGVLYAGTQSRGIIEIQNSEAKEIVSKPRSFFINALETDAQGKLWAGVRAGKDESAVFDESDPLKPARANAATGPVTAIARGAGDDLWVATDGHGAIHLEDGKATEKFTFEGTGGALRSDHIFGIFIDAEEVVWFATDKGVCRYDPNAMRAENVSESDSNANYVRAVMRSSRGHVVAGTNSGLYRNDGGKRWTPAPEIGRRIVYALGEDKIGRVLVATASGLFASSANSDTSLTRIPSSSDQDSVRAIATVGGTTYVGTYGYGVEKVQNSQRTLVWPDGNADSHLREITSLGRDNEDRLLIGTASAGLFIFDGQQTRTENALEKLKGDAVWSLLTDDSGIWIASAKGLYLFRRGELKDVAPGINARSLAMSADEVHAKQIWCATNGNGLMKVALDDQLGPVVSRLDIEQGLPSQRVFGVLSVKSNRGTENLIAGTNRGVVRYESSRVAPTVLPARIIGQRIHQPAELAQRLQLAYPQNSLLLDVTAISSRTFPEQFQYAFALYDSSGNIIRDKLAHDSQFPMEKLSPGTYKVVARAFTKDLTPAVPLSFEFSVARAPFPWTSTALGVLLLFASIALGWGYFQNRRIHRTSAALAAANRELASARLQLANETETERRRIARDLHDQTLADLRHLALLVDQLPAGANVDARANRAPSRPSALRAEIESISQEVRRICEDLSPSALENVGLSAALEFALSHAVEHAPPDCKFTYEFTCDEMLDEKLNLPPSTQIQIYRIAQEALSNVCRHSGARQVTMSATVSAADEFELSIVDDGRGFDESDGKRRSGRGVNNIRARASMIDASVDWHIGNGGGTVFTLRK